MFLEHKICILKLFLSDHMTLNTDFVPECLFLIKMVKVCLVYLAWLISLSLSRSLLQYGVCFGQLLTDQMKDRWLWKEGEKRQNKDRTMLRSPHPQTLFSSSSDLLGGDGQWTDVEKAQDKEAFKAVNVKLSQLLNYYSIRCGPKENECNRKREIWWTKDSGSVDVL